MARDLSSPDPKLNPLWPKRRGILWSLFLAEGRLISPFNRSLYGPFERPNLKERVRALVNLGLLRLNGDDPLVTPLGAALFEAEMRRIVAMYSEEAPNA